MKSATATSETMAATPSRARRPAGKRLSTRLAALFTPVGVTARLRLALFALLALPPAAMLYLLERGTTADPGRQSEQLLALWLALALIMLKPVSTLVARFVALGEIKAINAFCAALRRGEYARRLPLPPQGDDEHEILCLKRDLNWMAHNFEARETWLRAMLEETHQRKRLFEDLSRTDSLTGLSNRRHFDATVPGMVEEAAASGAPLALLLVDCDAFKAVNDRFGHPAGDAVLAVMGRVLRESVRDALDAAFRLGGDEFAVVLPHQGLATASRVAERIRQRFAASNPHQATASIGVACLDTALDATPRTASLLSRCDAALYRAKADGGNRVITAEAPAAPLVENEN